MVRQWDKGLKSGIWGPATSVGLIWDLPLIHCVILGKSFTFCVPQFAHLKEIMDNNSIYLTSLMIEDM